MTVTITQEHFYIGTIVFLVLMQVLQWNAISKLQKECDRIWEQLGTLVAGVSKRL